MIVTLPTVALPLILGYSLFVAVSGRLNPFSWPLFREDRPSWVLGLWIGAAVSIVALLNARKIYAPPVEQDAVELVLPAVVALACLIIPALGLFALHRRHITRANGKKYSTRFDWTLRENDPEQSPVVRSSSANCYASDDLPPESDTHADQLTEVIPTYLETIQTGQMVNYPHKDAVNDPDDTGSKHRVANSSIAGRSILNRNVVQHLSVEAEQNRSDAQTSQKLQIEKSRREETEKHLRITRKALAVLEAATRDTPVRQLQVQKDLERRLAKSLAATAALETNAMQEKAKRLEIERQAIKLKHKVINAKREIRRGAAARARALSTANKSIAFARQSVQIRTRLESELENAYDAIDIRQRTISSLVTRLDKEKRRTREEIGLVAKQLVLQDRHHKARRSLEEVARSVENNLASRLVKKVAKARPLMPDTDHSNLG